jgi:uncharacterized protein (TIGR03546 family)
MIIFIMKLLSSVRKAIAGRKYPHQLAWAVAFGLLLGIVPHGNLLALTIVIFVLTLKLNHAMAGLTAIGVSFAATRLDPYSHQVGDFVLSHPDVQSYAASAWQLPLLPWTDLNNTVVMGSFLIGVVALVPSFMLTYPIFRLFASKSDLSDEVESAAIAADSAKHDRHSDVHGDIHSDVHSVVVVDQGHKQITRPHRSTPQTASELPDFEEVNESASGNHEVAVETRIDVIRLQDVRAAQNNNLTNSASDGTSPSNDEPMDEALNYLLRQLRDSQSRKTA